MAWFVFNRRRSKREIKALERIAQALEDIRDFVRPPEAPDTSIEITSIEKPGSIEESEEIMPESLRMD